MIKDGVIPVLLAVFASTGFWSFVLEIYKSKSQNSTAHSRALRGILHDRILYLGGIYLQRGYITADEYENLVDDMYKPYAELGGNGTAKRMIAEVDKLPIKEKGGRDG